MSGRARFAAVAVIAGASACLAGVGYAAGLVHFTHSSASSAQYPPSKVTICHHTHSQTNPFVTITVSEHALPAHLGHGDTVGACSGQQGSGQQGSTETQTGQPKKEKPLHQSHGKSEAAHARKAEKAAGKSNHGKALGHSKSGQHGKGHAKNANHAKGHGQGKGKGHDKSKSHGHGQGQGHGPGGNHGNSGGGKGNGHKP